jgi:hypothetical protein
MGGFCIGVGKERDVKSPGNCGDWGDLVADSLGVMAGALLFWILYDVWFFAKLRMVLGFIVLYH